MLGLKIKLALVLGQGLMAPVDLVYAPNDPALYIVDQPGEVRVYKGGKLQKKPLLDIKDRVDYGGEKGLLSLAFHPKEKGRFFVNYTTPDPLRTRVSEFRAGSKKEKILLEFKQPYGNHNGGQVAFGPDGYLYIATGDGGSAGDPQNNSQKTSNLLGKILRIDVDKGKRYAIPSDNPFAKGGGAKEIYAWGLRNPWRFSFDRKTGELYTGDVGQYKWEEVNIVERGKNYGWRPVEGFECFLPKTKCGKNRYVPPIHVYGRKDGVSITGGFVYRGKKISKLVGAYVYADYGSGQIWALRKEKGKWVNRLLLKAKLPISSFGQKPNGELLLSSLAGEVYEIR